MKCSNCGYELRLGMKFCPQCGMRVPKAQSSNRTQQTADTETSALSDETQTSVMSPVMPVHAPIIDSERKAAAQYIVSEDEKNVAHVKESVLDDTAVNADEHKESKPYVHVQRGPTVHDIRIHGKEEVTEEQEAPQENYAPAVEQTARINRQDLSPDATHMMHTEGMHDDERFDEDLARAEKGRIDQIPIDSNDLDETEMHSAPLRSPMHQAVNRRKRKYYRSGAQYHSVETLPVPLEEPPVQPSESAAGPVADFSDDATHVIGNTDAAEMLSDSDKTTMLNEDEAAKAAEATNDADATATLIPQEQLQEPVTEPKEPAPQESVEEPESVDRPMVTQPEEPQPQEAVVQPAQSEEPKPQRSTDTHTQRSRTKRKLQKKREWQGVPGWVALLVACVLIAAVAFAYVRQAPESAETATQPVQESEKATTDTGDSSSAQPVLPKQVSSFSQYSWSNLAGIAQAMEQSGSRDAAMAIAEQYNLADTEGTLTDETKDITLKDGSTVTLRIADIYHDTKADGTPAGITFITSDSNLTHAMNSSRSSEGGWEDSEMRHWLNNDVLSELPDDLQQLIVPVNKMTNNAGRTSDSEEVTETQDSLWIPSYVEVFGVTNWNWESRNTSGYNRVLNSEGTQYAMFASVSPEGTVNGPNVIAAVHSSASPTWWTRTPSPSVSPHFRIIEQDSGPRSVADSNEDMGVVAGFCL